MIDRTIMFNWAYTTINGVNIKLTIKILGDSHKSNVAYYDDINSNISYEDNLAILKSINEKFKNITMLFKKVIPTKITDGVFLYYSATNADIEYMLDHPSSTVFALAKKFDAFSGIGIKGNIFKLNKGTGYQILTPCASDPIIIGFKYYDPYYIPLCGMSRRIESEMLDTFKFKANSTQVKNRKKKIQDIDTVFIPGNDMHLPCKDYLYPKISVSRYVNAGEMSPMVKLLGITFPATNGIPCEKVPLAKTKIPKGYHSAEVYNKMRKQIVLLYKGG